MTNTSTRPGIRVLLAKPVEPVRPVTDCATCNDGCECEIGVEDAGCEHWGCWGPAASNDCQSGDQLRQHMHAYAEYRADLFAYNQQSHRR